MTCQLKTRSYKIYKDQGYKIPSIGLLKSWKWNIDIKPTLVFGSFTTDKFQDFTNKFDMKVFREYLREMIPMTVEENKLITFEEFLYGCQLNAIEWYQKISDYNEFYNTIFNQHVNIFIDFKDGPDSVDIEEEYYDRNNYENPK